MKYRFLLKYFLILRKKYLVKANLKIHLILPKTYNLNCLHHVTLKIYLSETRMEVSVESNFIKKFNSFMHNAVKWPNVL